MSETTGDLFPHPAKGKTRAPEQLNPKQLKQIHEWAERKVPWVSRGAFDAFTTVDDYIETALEWFGSAGLLKQKWPLTCQVWIRKEERKRLESLAKGGSADAKLALREPEEWQRRYDRKIQATRHVASSGGEALISPAGGNVLTLTPRNPK